METPLYDRLIGELLRNGIGFYRVEKAGLGDSAGGAGCADIDSRPSWTTFAPPTTI